MSAITLNILKSLKAEGDICIIIRKIQLTETCLFAPAAYAKNRF